jgi:phenylacetate-CoA ligase
LIDPEGRPVTQPGRVGEIVGTGFDNLVMPFVRYRTGDYAVLGESPHTLMAGSPVVDRIEGRLQEFVVCADHRLVTVTTIGAAHVQELERCLRIQYEQFEPGRLILRVVSMQPLDADSKARVCRAIEHKTQGGCSVEVQEVDHIELTGRGKQRLLVQHLDVGRYLGSALTGSVSSASPDNLLPATAPEPLPHSKKTETTLPLDKPAWTIPSVFPAFRGSIELVGKELQLLTRHVTRRAILAKRRANLLTAGERDDQQRLRERQIKLLADSVNSAIRRIPRFRPLGPVPADGSIFEVLRRNVQLTNKAHLLSDRSLLYPNGGRRRPWWPVGKTSGTSGTPLEVFRDIDSVVWEEAFHIQSWRWAGVEPNEPQAVLRGDLAGLSEANAGRYSLWDPFGSQLFLATRSLSGRSVAAMIAACQTYRCVALRAYPSAADQLAKLVEETGSRLCFKSVITSSEPLYPVQRERIERVFGCKVLNIYGMAERVAYATECEHGHLHLNTDYSFVEILDEAGQATDDFGSIVGTSFRNQVMPLLRYKLSDKARWMPGACLCGRTYPRIELASGKVEDQLFDRDGGAVNSSIVTFAFKGVDNIAKAQVAQVDPHRWEIRIVPGRGFSKRDSDRLLSNLNHYVSSRVAYAIRVVDDIPAQQSGKYKWIAQEWVRN